MFKGDSMYSILPIDATYFFNITKQVQRLSNNGLFALYISSKRLGLISK